MIKFIIKVLLLTGLMIGFIYYTNQNQFIWVTGDNGYKTIAVFMLVLALLNTFLKPLLSFISIPITCITMGLFSFVINFGITYLADYLVPDVHFANLWVMFLFSMIYAFANSIIDYFFSE